MNVTLAPIITIDGPTASGKGTVARAVAEALGFHLLDSGAIYRAFALACISRYVKPFEINNLEEIAKALSLEFQGKHILLDGRDVSDEIRSEAAGMAASQFSAIPQVRKALLERQRAFAQLPGLVADGRDMGTVVFPEATLKVFLTTSAEVRGARRHRQVTKTNSTASEQTTPSFESVVENIRQRDAQDKGRAIAPLRPAADAVVIDNAQHGKQDSINAVLALWRLRVYA